MPLYKRKNLHLSTDSKGSGRIVAGVDKITKTLSSTLNIEASNDEIGVSPTVSPRPTSIDPRNVPDVNNQPFIPDSLSEMRKQENPTSTSKAKRRLVYSSTVDKKRRKSNDNLSAGITKNIQDMNKGNCTSKKDRDNLKGTRFRQQNKQNSVKTMEVDNEGTFQDGNSVIIRANPNYVQMPSPIIKEHSDRDPTEDKMRPITLPSEDLLMTLNSSSDEEDVSEANVPKIREIVTSPELNSEITEDIAIDPYANIEAIAISQREFNKADEINLDDPEWLKFRELVSTSPELAQDQLVNDFIEAGKKGSLLVSKLITLAIRSINMENSPSNCMTRTNSVRFASLIIDVIIKLILRFDNSLENVVDLVNVTIVHLCNFPTDVLELLVSRCLNYMKGGNDKDGHLPPSWIELVGQTITILSKRYDIPLENDLITGHQYVRSLLNELCKMNWDSQTTPSILALLRFLPNLGPEDISLVLCKIRSSMQHIKPPSFPTVISQLLSLNSSNCPMEIINVCSEYFDDVDVSLSDNASLESLHKKNALGTVLFYFTEEARKSDKVFKAALKVIDYARFDFEILKRPFLLSLVLGIMRYDHYRKTLVDKLKSTLLESVHYSSICRDSHWFLETLCCDDTDSLMDMFSKIIRLNASQIDFISEGTLALALNLINGAGMKNVNLISNCKMLAECMLTNMVKLSSEELRNTIKQLLKCKTSRSTDCLAMILQCRTRQIIDPAFLGMTYEILNQLMMMDSHSATKIIKGMGIALQLSHPLMDALIKIMYKSMSKSATARTTSVRIMIDLLSNAKAVGDVPFSQYSATQTQRKTGKQTHSDLLQIPDNHPLCIEILTIIKQYLGSKTEVRVELYQGFPYVIQKNPSLCELVCSQILSHAKQFISFNNPNESDMQSDGNVQLRFNDVLELLPLDSSAPVIVKERLGMMFQCIGRLVTSSYTAFRDLDDDPPTVIKELEKLAQEYIVAIIKIGTGGIEMIAAELINDGTGAYSLETVRYMENVLSIQIMQLLQAMIEYSCTEKHSSELIHVKQLFYMYDALKESFDKRGKTSKPKRLNKLNEGESKKASPATVDGKSKVDKVTSAILKKQTFTHIFALKNVADILLTLYSDAPEKGALNDLFANNMFEKMLLDAVKQRLRNTSHEEQMREGTGEPTEMQEILIRIAGIIWDYIARTLSSSPEVEEAIAIKSRLDMVNDICKFVCNLDATDISKCFIKAFGNNQQEEAAATYNAMFKDFFHSWKCVVTSITFEREADLQQVMFDILNQFVILLYPDNESIHISSKISAWIWTYMTESKEVIVDFQLAESVVSCWLTILMKGNHGSDQTGIPLKQFLLLAEAIRMQLGCITETQETIQNDAEHDSMFIINDDSASKVFTILMEYAGTRVEHVVAALKKIKFAPLECEAVIDNVQRIVDRCCELMTQIVSICLELVVCKPPAGLPCTTVLDVTSKIFNAMTMLAQHYMALSKTQWDFDIELYGFLIPVNLTLQKFKSAAEIMIEHIDLVQREHLKMFKASPQTKKTSGTIRMPSSSKKLETTIKKLAPDVVYTIENFAKEILLVANALEKKEKKGILLRKGMKRSILRDFKIDGKSYHAALVSAQHKEKDQSHANHGPANTGKCDAAHSSQGKDKQKSRKLDDDDHQETEIMQDFESEDDDAMMIDD